MLQQLSEAFKLQLNSRSPPATTSTLMSPPRAGHAPPSPAAVLPTQRSISFDQAHTSQPTTLKRSAPEPTQDEPSKRPRIEQAPIAGPALTTPSEPTDRPKVARNYVEMAGTTATEGEPPSKVPRLASLVAPRHVPSLGSPPGDGASIPPTTPPLAGSTQTPPVKIEASVKTEQIATPLSSAGPAPPTTQSLVPSLTPNTAVPPSSSQVLQSTTGGKSPLKLSRRQAFLRIKTELRNPTGIVYDQVRH